MKNKTLYERYLKRCFDIFCSSFALIILSPIILIIALLVYIKLGAPVLFTQERPGKDEKIFKIYKFRSMSDARDENGKLLSDGMRLTRFGKILRSTSLDELPELINILKGDMTIVGPRPLLVGYLPYYTKEERHRHDVRPGLTGLAQISGRNTLTWEEKFEYDIKYINHITFYGDMTIIFKTVEKVFRRSDILIGHEFKVGKLLEERADWSLTADGAIRPVNRKE